MKNKTEIRATALQVIATEEANIQTLKSSIDDNFTAIIEIIYSSKGRLVVTGIGKSALIARKIVATLNSTGTPSLFMHASDALHGDLGMIQADDIVLCLSKSGETAELKTLIPILKSLNIQLIAITARVNSFLATNSDYVLYTPIDKEADPHNLVPTTSTTAQLVLGDTIAMCLLKLKNFEAQDFARVHPAGTLGKRLHLKVRDLCVKNEQPTVLENTSMQKVIFEISTKRLGATAVVGKTNNLIGIITDGDIRRMLEKHTSIHNLKATDIMTRNPKYLHIETLATDALILMQDHNITQLPILSDNKYVGMIHIHDLLKEGIG